MKECSLDCPDKGHRAMHRLSRYCSELTEARFLVSSRIAQLPMLLPLMQLVLLLWWFLSSLHKKKTRKQVLYVLVGSYDIMHPSWFRTSWSWQLATGDGVTRTRAIGSCYHLLPPWYPPYMVVLLTLSLACCVSVVRDAWEAYYFVVDCCVAEGIVVENCCCRCSAYL